MRLGSCTLPRLLDVGDLESPRFGPPNDERKKVAPLSNLHVYEVALGGGCVDGRVSIKSAALNTVKHAQSSYKETPTRGIFSQKYPHFFCLCKDHLKVIRRSEKCLCQNLRPWCWEKMMSVLQDGSR